MFDVKKHLIKVQGGRQYLPVAARLVWFRQEHPDWGIETRVVTIDTEKQYAIFEARVHNAEGKLMATGTKMENVKGFPDYVEKSETGSIGRALAVCGYGTQFAPDLDEVNGGQNPRIVDSPQGSGAYDNSGNRGRGGYSRHPEVGTRNQAPQVTDEAVCKGCGKELNQAQVTYSVRIFGCPLCPNCQKERKVNPDMLEKDSSAGLGLELSETGPYDSHAA